MIRQALLTSVVFVALLAVSRVVLAENPAPASQLADAWQAVLGEEDSYRTLPAKEEVQIGDLKAMFTRSKAGKSRPYGPDEAWFCPVPNKTGRGVFLGEGTAAKIPDEFFWIPIQIKCKPTRDGRLLIGWVRKIPYPPAPDERPGWQPIAKGSGIAYYIDPTPQALFKGTLFVVPTGGKGDLRPNLEYYLQVTPQRRIALTINDEHLPALKGKQVECGAKPADGLPPDKTRRITVGWVRLGGDAGQAPAAAGAGKPVVVNGLAVQAAPSKATFVSPGEPLEFKVTLKNVSDKPFSVNTTALVTDTWRFYDVTATTDAGVTFKSPWPAMIPPAPLRGPAPHVVKPSIPSPDPMPKLTPLAPGESVDVTITIFATAFWRKSTGKTDLGEGPCHGLGKYRATFTLYPAPAPGQKKADSDPAPWPGKEVVCEPVNFDVIQKDPPDPPGPPRSL